jgi:hypothetical protein
MESFTPYYAPQLNIPGVDSSAAVVLSGTANPTRLDGKNSDLYLNTTTLELYGPKQNNCRWPALTRLPRQILGSVPIAVSTATGTHVFVTPFATGYTDYNIQATPTKNWQPLDPVASPTFWYVTKSNTGFTIILGTACNVACAFDFVVTY